jgi:hypothetical protein
VDAEYVLWFIPDRRQPFPIAATTTVTTGTTGATTTGTTTLLTLGEEHLNRHLLPGARFAVGYWLTEPNPWVPGGQIRDLGAEVRSFFVGQRSVTASRVGTPTLVRPFFDLNDNQVSAVIVAAPGLATGALMGTAKASLWGTEANVWKNLCYDAPGTNVSLDGMVGLRYVGLDASIAVERNSLFAANPQGFPNFAPLAGDRVIGQDAFSTHNNFYGGQFGLRGRWYLNYAILTAQAQLALGVTHEDLNINGAQVVMTPDGRTTVSPGSLFALPSNIGRFNRDKFAQVPEMGGSLAFPLGDHLILSTRFTALYWNRILRPGEQVDPVIDVTQIPNFQGAAGATPTGLRAPGVPFRQSHLWLLGLTFSAEVTW